MSTKPVKPASTATVVTSSTTPTPVKSKPVPVEKETITRAATALLNHLKKTAPKNALLDETVSITLSIHLNRIPGRYIAKPVQIPLPHTLLNPEDGIEICVISKDPTDELKEKLLSSPVAGVTKVLAVGKLKKNYHEFAKRRELVHRYDAFFCDDRVVTMMPKLCGKVFFDRKKLPVPVRVTGSAPIVAKEITKARDSTYMIIGAGQTIAVRVGKNTMTPEQITDNVYAVLSTAIDNIPKKWRAVGSLYIQATGTVALPIYKALPMLTIATEDDDEEEDDDDVGNDEDDAKYRYLNENLDDDDDDDGEEEEEEENKVAVPVSKKQSSTTTTTASTTEIGKKRARTSEGTVPSNTKSATSTTTIMNAKTTKAVPTGSTATASTSSTKKAETAPSKPVPSGVATVSATTGTTAKKSRTLEPPTAKNSKPTSSKPTGKANK